MRRTLAEASAAPGQPPDPDHGLRGLPPAVAPAPSGPGTGSGLPVPGAAPAAPGTAAVDADVPAAVGRVLAEILRRRTAQAAALDGVFARDVAERVARFTLDGGKRMRSRLLWWSLRACGGGTDMAGTACALRVAAALELVQTCALVHDDVMDHSPLRRGRPALHADLAAQYATSVPREAGGSFGAAAAVLAGDLALAWADDTFADAGLDPEAAHRVRGIWSAMRTEMVAGQYLDVQGQATACRSAARAVRIAWLKSALYSVERPLALGAALAGAGAAATRALRSAGRCAGIAFQLRDDLDDVFADPRRTGKPSGDDVREGKPTYLTAVARANAAARGDRSSLAVLDRALGVRDLSPADLAEVRQVLVSTGARAAVEDRIGRLLAHSMRHLAGAVPETPALHRLRELVCTVAGTDPAAGPAPRYGPGAPKAAHRAAGAERGSR
ncbi:polyprenyl synthetase family protein [Peterkaempfera sp. SMS 1(5)a]|uniref:polyprenyl synthetase family protein n=1 Tax=Peterkaempfera podocarpi TaxID=3232308 RepID=UPI00366B1883